MSRIAQESRRRDQLAGVDAIDASRIARQIFLVGLHELATASVSDECLNDEAGIDNFRWHDLRHTWATLHAQAGTPMHVLRELGVWASDAMVRRYAHFTPEHLASYVQNFGERVAVVPVDFYDSATSGGIKH